MTGRRLAALAAAAVTIAVLALVAGPFLHRHQVAPPAPPSTPQPTPTRRLTGVATAAARRALACPPPRATPPPSTPGRVTCGRLTVTRSQTRCTRPDRCQTELVGTLATETTTAPVALTVTLARTRAGWQPVAVSS